MRFEKFQAVGNAYLVMEGVGEEGGIPEASVRRICHADYGAGSDGILEILPSRVAHARVRIYNPDGGQAEFSGNGSRIAVAYLCRRDGLSEVTIETVKGVVRGEVDGTSVGSTPAAPHSRAAITHRVMGRRPRPSTRS